MTNSDVPQGGFAEAGADLELVGISKRFPGFTRSKAANLTKVRPESYLRSGWALRVAA